MNPSRKTGTAGNEPLRAAHISARIDRLPAVASIWRLVALLSIAGFFELYDLFQTAYISPGLIREGIFATGSQGLFGFSDQAAFASATPARPPRRETACHRWPVRTCRCAR